MEKRTPINRGASRKNRNKMNTGRLLLPGALLVAVSPHLLTALMFVNLSFPAFL